MPLTAEYFKIYLVPGSSFTAYVVVASVWYHPGQTGYHWGFLLLVPAVNCLSISDLVRESNLQNSAIYGTLGNSRATHVIFQYILLVPLHSINDRYPYLEDTCCGPFRTTPTHASGTNYLVFKSEIEYLGHVSLYNRYPWLFTPTCGARSMWSQKHGKVQLFHFSRRTD